MSATRALSVATMLLLMLLLLLLLQLLRSVRCRFFDDGRACKNLDVGHFCTVTGTNLTVRRRTQTTATAAGQATSGFKLSISTIKLTSQYDSPYRYVVAPGTSSGPNLAQPFVKTKCFASGFLVVPLPLINSSFLSHRVRIFHNGSGVHSHYLDSLACKK